MLKSYKNLFFVFVIFFAASYNTFSQQVTYDWKHVIPGNTYTALCCMATDSSGYVYVGGRLDSTVSFVDTTVTNTQPTGFIAKFDTAGNMIWFKQFEYSATVYSMCFDSEDNFYISGMYRGKVRINDTLLYTWDVDTTYFGMFLAKFDTDGNRIWAKTTAGSFYYESGFAKLKQMTIDKDDNLVLISYAINEIEFFDTTATYTKTIDSLWVTTPYPHWEYFYDKTNVLVKFNKHGQKLWLKDVGMHQQHYLAIATDYSNNILLTGYFWDDYPFVVDTLTLNASGGENIFIIKYNPNGHLLWAQRGGGASNGPNIGYDIVADENDNVYLTGIATGGNIEFGGNILHNGFYKNLFLIKYSNTGNFEWFNHYGTVFYASNYDYGLSVSIRNSEIYVSGLFLDSLLMGNEILNSFPYLYASGIFIRFDFNGNLIDAAMEHDSLQCTPIYFFNGVDGNYYVAGNLLGNNENALYFGRFFGSFLVGNHIVTVKNENIVIFPNPCSEHINIQSNNNEIAFVEIFNITGNLVLSSSINSTFCTINISSLQRGVYVVKAGVFFSKIIVN